MKYLKLTLLLFLFSQSIIGYSQNQNTLELDRFFWGVIPAVGLKANALKSGRLEVAVGGIQFEVGNYWAFKTRKRSTGFFRLTWTRIGLHNYGLLVASPQVGLGFHVDYSNNTSLDFVINTGLIIVSDDALMPDFRSTYAVYPQIRFNFDRFSIGLEYTYKHLNERSINFSAGFHYFGIVFGGRGGNRIN
ncbi:MAG: hypothetical protein PHQ74_00860 [Crocinitomicaceae bacterium]|nr:hypothetical protein [Crocinitomicaceae bacterium]